MKFKFVIFFTFILSLFVADVMGQAEAELLEIATAKANEPNKCVYLKDFKATLPADAPQPIRYSLLLTGDTKYRFTIISSRDYQGEAVLQLFDSARLQLSTNNPATGKDVQNIDFKCLKTGVYHVVIFFKDRKEGMAVGLLSYVEKL